MYHISDFKKLERCERLFWLSKRKQKEHIPFVVYKEHMSDLIIELLMIRNPFIGQANDEGSLAMQAYEENKNLINARFCYEDLRIKLPVLLQEEGRRIAYFPFVSCYPKEQEAQGIADTLSALALCGVRVDAFYIIHLAADYVRQKDLDVRRLLVISEHLYNHKNRPHKRLSELVEEKKRDIRPLLARLRKLERAEECAQERTMQCTRGGKCPYFDDCFPQRLPLDSILHLVQSSHKLDMQKEGILYLQDADLERIEGSRFQYAQIMAARNGGRFADLSAIGEWLRHKIRYPLSYLDFEWETLAYPPYEGMKPFDVLTFQYSLHTEACPGAPLKQMGFLKEGDCRQDFIRQLLNDVPKEGSILVYNMEGAEKLRLVQLAKQFPAYEKQLAQIWERMVDLSLPFASGNFYDLRMEGMYSLKKVVALFSSATYERLAISQGMEAVEAWRKYQSARGEEKKKLQEQLSAYCAMDTYAEYIVYHALCDMVEQKRGSICFM